MRVFISWSGDVSRAVAEALRDWLPLVLHYVEPWMSEMDINAGERWADSVANELETSNFGIICITRENANSPWILFEAGALAKSMKGSKVIPLLFDIDFREISGPLAQFQAKKLEKAGVGEVVQAINRMADTPDDVSRATQLFEALWSQLEAAIQSIPTDSEPARRSRPEGEILEELVSSVRTLDGRVREMSDIESVSAPSGGSASQMTVHAELASKAMQGPGDPLCVLAAAAGFKDSVPWLFELGTEAYQALISNSERSELAIQKFLHGVEAVRGSPLPWAQFGIDPERLNPLVEEVSSLLVAPGKDGAAGEGAGSAMVPE